MNILSYLFGSRPAHAQVPLPDYKLLTSVTYFTKREIQRIYARYCVICRSDGLISIKQFAKIPEVTTYPLMLLAFQFEANDSYGLLNFSQMILLLSNFSAKSMFYALLIVSFSSLTWSFIR
jgi:Ca2+-binding EF-hand superfamily protein